jgi:iron complex transport system substrate-binding protein
MVTCKLTRQSRISRRTQELYTLDAYIIQLQRLTISLRSGSLLLAYGFALAFLVLLSCDNSGKQAFPSLPQSYSRIISFAPSITETLFALSLGDKIVGVSSFCKYPKAVEKIPKVGGYTNPNYETVLRLKPDLVILLKEHAPVLDFLKKNRIEYLLVDNHDFSSIIRSFHLIGEKCGKAENADNLANCILSELSMDNMQNSPSPKVFLCIDRENQGCGSISQAYSAGESTFYHNLLKMAAMNNAIAGSKIAYPQVSAEGIITMQPDIIIDIAMRSEKMTLDRLKADWQSLTMIPAVKNNMVFCLAGDYLTIPGPRILMTLKEFKKIRALYHQSRFLKTSGKELAGP